MFFGSFLNSCGCSTAKSKTPPQETIFFYPLAGTELGSQPSLIARDRELVSVIHVDALGASIIRVDTLGASIIHVDTLGASIIHVDALGASIIHVDALGASIIHVDAFLSICLLSAIH